MQKHANVQTNVNYGNETTCAVIRRISRKRFSMSAKKMNLLCIHLTTQTENTFKGLYIFFDQAGDLLTN